MSRPFLWQGEQAWRHSRNWNTGGSRLYSCVKECALSAAGPSATSPHHFSDPANLSHPGVSGDKELGDSPPSVDSGHYLISGKSSRGKKKGQKAQAQHREFQLSQDPLHRAFPSVMVVLCASNQSQVGSWVLLFLKSHLVVWQSFLLISALNWI